MHPILFTLGDWAISSYGVALSLGLIAAVIVVALDARRLHLRSALWLDAILAAITVGILSARLGYALINWSYFQTHLTEVLEIWQGGLSWHAGFIGGALGAWLIAHRARDVQPSALLDMLVSGVAIGAAFGWAGSYLSASAYGRELFPGDTFFFIAHDAPDLYGQLAPRWPSQLLGVGWSVLIFLALWSTRGRRWPIGLRLWLFVVAYSTGACVIDLTRADAMPNVLGLRLDLWLDLLFTLIGLIGVVVTRRATTSLDNSFA